MIIHNQKNNITGRKIEIRKQKPRSRHIIFVKKFFLYTGGLLLLGGGIYFFFQSELFLLSLDRVEILGTSRIAPNEIEEIIQKKMTEQRWYFFPQSHILFFSTQEAKKRIHEAFVTVEGVEVKKRPLNRLIIEIKEFQPAITWISTGQYYYLNENGVVLEGVPVPTLMINDQALQVEPLEVQLPPGANEPAEKPVESATLSSGSPQEVLPPEVMIDFSHLDQKLPQIIDSSNTLTKIGQEILPNRSTTFILSLDSIFSEKTGLQRKNYIISQPLATDVRLITKDNWTIFFETKNSLERQIENLVLIIKEKLPQRQQPIEYIDLRDPNNIIYLK